MKPWQGVVVDVEVEVEVVEGPMQRKATGDATSRSSHDSGYYVGLKAT
jgi:hypothetical protein